MRKTKFAAVFLAALVVLTAGCTADTEPTEPPVAADVEYEEYELPYPLPVEIAEPDIGVDVNFEAAEPEESDEPEPEPEPNPQPEAVPEPAAQAAPANQIIFGYDWPAADIFWEVSITDPGDITLIEGFLRDAQPVTMELPLLGGVLPHLMLTLDGELVRFTTTAHHYPNHTSERVLFFREEDRPGLNAYSVDWRIWRVLTRYNQSDDYVTDIIYAMPALQLVHPQGGVFSMGQMFEQSGVALGDIRQILVWNIIVDEVVEVTITDDVRIAALWEMLAFVQLTPQGAPERIPWEHGDLLSVNLITDNHRVAFSLNATAMEFWPDPPMAFSGEGGLQLHVQLTALFGD